MKTPSRAPKLTGMEAGMEALRGYLNSLHPELRDQFAERCGTTQNYLRKAISKGQRLALETAILIDQESGGVVRCENLRPDVDWDYLTQRSPECAA